MNARWQLIIAAAGTDDLDFTGSGFTSVKNLVPYGKNSILGAAIASYSLGADRTNIAIQAQEAKMHNTDVYLQTIFPHVSFSLIPGMTKGALCSAVYALAGLELDEPLVIAAGDSEITGGIGSIIENLQSTNCAAGTVIFESSLKRWSYARMDNKGNLLEMAEKRQISRHASAGIFYFAQAGLFLEAAQWVLLQNMNTNGEFYLSSALNYLITAGEKVIAVNLPESQQYIPLTNPADLYAAVKSSK